MRASTSTVSTTTGGRTSTRISPTMTTRKRTPMTRSLTKTTSRNSTKAMNGTVTKTSSMTSMRTSTPTTNPTTCKHTKTLKRYLPMYNVKATRNEDGSYTFSYGKGAKKITARLDNVGGKWSTTGDFLAEAPS